MVRLRFGAMMIVALFVSLMMGQIRVAAQATPAASPAAFADTAASIQAGADWIASQQLEDGGWPGFTGESDPGITIDAVLALASARNAGAEVNLSKALRYLEANGKTYAESSSGAAAKLVMAIKAVDQDPRDFAGIDAFAIATDDYNVETKLYGNGVYDTALVMLAYGAMGRTGPDRIIETLTKLQIEDGSWAFDGTTELGNGDTNTTAMVVQAMARLKRGDDPMIAKALAYLKTTRQEGGFPFQGGELATADANSTGVVAQALIATGQDLVGGEWGDIVSDLAAFQNGDGSFSYMFEPRDANLYASVQMLSAVAGQAFPILWQRDYDKIVALPTCTPVQLATPVADDDELACAA